MRPLKPSQAAAAASSALLALCPVLPGVLLHGLARLRARTPCERISALKLARQRDHDVLHLYPSLFLHAWASILYQ